MTQETVMIENKTGIHARPASVFVQTATKFKSKIQIEAKGKKVDAKSILMLMSMGLVKGTELTIIAEGEDEENLGAFFHKKSPVVDPANIDGMIGASHRGDRICQNQSVEKA